MTAWRYRNSIIIIIIIIIMQPAATFNAAFVFIYVFAAVDLP